MSDLLSKFQTTTKKAIKKALLKKDSVRTYQVPIEMFMKVLKDNEIFLDTDQQEKAKTYGKPGRVKYLDALRDLTFD